MGIFPSEKVNICQHHPAEFSHCFHSNGVKKSTMIIQDPNISQPSFLRNLRPVLIGSHLLVQPRPCGPRAGLPRGRENRWEAANVATVADWFRGWDTLIFFLIWHQWPIFFWCFNKLSVGVPPSSTPQKMGKNGTSWPLRAEVLHWILAEQSWGAQGLGVARGPMWDRCHVVWRCGGRNL